MARGRRDDPEPAAAVDAETVDATAFLAPYPARRVRRPVRLALTAHSYPLEPVAERSWLAAAFRAFALVARRRAVHDLLILGTGNGLDALAALEILDLRSLAVTDLSEKSVATARANVLAHVLDADACEITFHAGDLFTCVPRRRRFSLVYENLPNIRATPGLDVELGTIAGRFFDAAELEVPALFERYLLALHYECLRQAHEHLVEDGGVLTALGGRVPLEVALELHRRTGYEPELLVFDVKPQSEPELVLPGYCRAELRHGIEFTFYAPESVAIVAEARADGLEGELLREAVADRLADYELSARQAAARRAGGEAVAHSVLMILGERRQAGDLAA